MRDSGQAPEPAPEGDQRPLLVVLSGPSGAGKDAVLDELARRGRKFHRVVTCTTRPPRPGEREGIDYYFITDQAFDALISGGGLLEHAVVYGHRSGVPRQQVADKLAQGDDVYVRTDVQGAAAIKLLAPSALLIFIAPSSMGEIEARIRARRSDGEDRIQQRLKAAHAEMARRSEFGYVIVNEPGRLEETADRLIEILDAERLRPGGRAHSG